MLEVEYEPHEISKPIPIQVFQIAEIKVVKCSSDPDRELSISVYPDPQKGIFAARRLTYQMDYSANLKIHNICVVTHEEYVSALFPYLARELANLVFQYVFLFGPSVEPLAQLVNPLTDALKVAKKRHFTLLN